MPQSSAEPLQRQADDTGDVIRAPRGVGVALLLFVGLIALGGFYLLIVRGDALFLDLAALSGLLFCF
ncbi:MAG: hypothetical protein KDJ45_15800 [Hyphomicrobiaceae bacterium]|nr:hypothetical protein [Hyphomicrobiaceae bacterium]MCC0011466.1 hypothetical protein [Hyphomicrobiaceae bacterium]